MRPLCPLIDDNLEAIRAQAREYGVARLEVFGSVCTPDFDPARSDVDFLVEYPEGCDVDPVRTKALESGRSRREAACIRQVLYRVPGAAIRPESVAEGVV